jgi:hypothetical protein
MILQWMFYALVKNDLSFLSESIVVSMLEVVLMLFVV